MIKKAVKFLAVSAVLVALASCNTDTYKKINYLQDVQDRTTMSVNKNEGIIVQPKDQISIVVSSRNPELAAMFNLVNVSYQAGSEMVSSGGQQRLMGYSVDTNGNIDFPILGSLHVAGLNRWQVAELVKTELQDRNLLKDPVVTVEFMNFRISVLGEVTRPGTFTVSGDKINILEALSIAGDLTIYGKRDKVQVIREYGGERTIYLLDLRDSQIFNSPAYYLRQNDIILVEPNKVRAGQSTLNENNLRSTSFWISIGSLLMTLTTLIINVTK
ncbi:MAG: polysaccharide biosynthesis/export family protein [Bacteroidales bacterium]|nr:polysaccharide biosynthesis/export family protein [Bacteroidales bacterium]